MDSASDEVADRSLSLGAAGVQEAIYSILMMRHGFRSPPRPISRPWTRRPKATGSPGSGIDDIALDCVMSNSFALRRHQRDLGVRAGTTVRRRRRAARSRGRRPGGADRTPRTPDAGMVDERKTRGTDGRQAAALADGRGEQPFDRGGGPPGALPQKLVRPRGRSSPSPSKGEAFRKRVRRPLRGPTGSGMVIECDVAEARDGVDSRPPFFFPTGIWRSVGWSRLRRALCRLLRQGKSLKGRLRRHGRRKNFARTMQVSCLLLHRRGASAPAAADEETAGSLLDLTYPGGPSGWCLNYNVMGVAKAGWRRACAISPPILGPDGIRVKRPVRPARCGRSPAARSAPRATSTSKPA